MTQNVCVSVQMDEKSFHDFASFDLLRHNKGWQRLAVNTAGRCEPLLWRSRSKDAKS